MSTPSLLRFDMNLVIEQGETLVHPFDQIIMWKEVFYQESYSKQLDFFFLDNKNNQYHILGEVNLLPFFWKDQKATIPSNLAIKDLDHLDLTRPYFNLIEDNKIDRNYQFAIEQALLAFLDIKNLLPNNLNLNSTPEVEISTLHTSHESPQDFSGTVKIKIGQRTAKSDNILLRSLVSKDLRIRLDANRSLTPQVLDQILEDIPASMIEYIEEPFNHVMHWMNFSRRDEFLLALDETLCDDQYLQKFNHLKNYIGALVIKPSFNSSISEVFSMLTDPNYKNIDLVLSSSYEPAQSLNTLIHLANYINKVSLKEQLAHGLGTLVQMQQQSLFSLEGTKVQAYTFSHFSL